MTSLAGMELTPDDIEHIKKEIRVGKRVEKLIDERVRINSTHRAFAPIRFWDFVQTVLHAVERRRYKSEIHYRRKIRRIADVILEWAIFAKLKRGVDQ